VKAPFVRGGLQGVLNARQLLTPFSGDPERDAGALIAVIRAGRVYAAFDSIAGPASLAFSAESRRDQSPSG